MNFGPDNPSAPQKEVTPTPLGPPDRRVQGDRPDKVAADAPPRPIGRNEAQLDHGSTSTGAKQCSRPGNRAIADEVDAVRFKNIRKILDRFGYESAAKTGQPNQPPP